MNFTAFLYFLKGTTLLYAGQEYCCDHTPSLFEKDVFPRAQEKDITPLLQRLYAVKKNILSPEDCFRGTADDAYDIAVLERDDNHTRKLGVFSLKGKAAEVAVSLPDGMYTNHLDGTAVQVVAGYLHCTGDPVLLTTVHK